MCENRSVPERERSFAGYTYQQRLSVGFFGAVYRAVGTNHQEARILLVDPGLMAQSGFSDALERFGGDLGLLEHKNVQSTLLVGRTPDDEHVVITEATPGTVTLDQLLADVHHAGRELPLAIALAIGRSVVSGLTHAHSVGIVHGGIHPRSVLVDVHGGVKLADFAAARALASAAVEADELQLLEARGFVAPELALGDSPSAATDVYAAGALLHTLLAGAPPPVPLSVARPLAAVIEQALSTDVDVRYPSGIELRAALRAGIEASRAEVGSVKDVAMFAGELRGAAEANLDAETEDVLAAIAGCGLSRAASVRHEDPELDVDSALDDLVAGLPVAGETPPPEVVRSQADDEDDDAPTSVDYRQTSGDPVSALIRTEPPPSMQSLVRLGSETEEDTYIPPAMTDSDVDLAHAAKEATARSQAAAERKPGPKPPKREFRPPSALDAPVPELSPSRGGSGIWLITAIVAVGGLGAVLYSQMGGDDGPAEDTTTVVGPSIKAGDLEIDASEPEAAVWLKIGATPTDSMPLSVERVHQVRIEHEGYEPSDINVVGSMWTGSGNRMRAVLHAGLSPAPRGSTPRAYPEAPKRETSGREGRGVLHIESDPPGTTAYLLVGFTPATLRDVRAEASYELKIVKDGFTPGFIVVRPGDWKQGAGLKRSISATAELVALPPQGGKKK